eukprot:576527-Alexandrium_andersonii.AAC.1
MSIAQASAKGSRPARQSPSKAFLHKVRAPLELLGGSDPFRPATGERKDDSGGHGMPEMCAPTAKFRACALARRET